MYFPNGQFNTETPVEVNNTRKEYLLQTGDVVSVRVKTLDEASESYFNLSSVNAFNQFNLQALYVNGYSIDKDGNITLPEVGDVEIANLSVEKAAKVIQEKLIDYLSNATVLVKLVSFKITVLGEVSNPGYYYIYNDQATILEGLGLAGDLSDFGNRKNITLVRQTENGSKAILIDLKDPDLLGSDYYYLSPNDVIYVQPLRAKNARGNLSTLTVLGVLFGGISSAVLLLQFLKNNY